MTGFGPEIRDAYARLFADDPDKSDEILSWRFRDNPHGEAMFAVAREDAVIRGMIALMPTRLAIGGGTARGFQAIDTIVHPELQGRFVFVKLGRLIEDFVASQEAILWGFPNAAAARGWFGRLGWTRTGTVPFLIRPLRTGYFLRRLAPWLGRLDVRLFGGPQESDSGARPALGGRYDALWDGIRERVGIGVDRSADWLRWRLARPGAGYEWAHDPGSTAFVATRTVAKHGGMIAYVMEALAAPTHGGSLTRLLRSELARLGRDRGAEVALAWCDPNSANYRHYRAAGFLPFPDKLRPAEIHHGYWQAEGDVAVKDWYLSYLDSDTV